MGELQDDYGDRIDFQIISPDETKARGDEIERYNLASRSHGLVAFDQAGEAVLTISGHQFGRAEIEMAIAQVIAQ